MEGGQYFFATNLYWCAQKKHVSFRTFELSTNLQQTDSKTNRACEELEMSLETGTEILLTLC